MPTLDDVYRKFGEAAEAAQLLETELGTMLLEVRAYDEGLLVKANRDRASDVVDKINRHTLGQLIKILKQSRNSVDALEPLLWDALMARNRLQHTFYREHNNRRNSDEGRAKMLADLGAVHDTLMNAYKELMRLSGVDLDGVAVLRMPTDHLPI